MAQKEVKVKITVYNKELEVTREELEKLNKAGHITEETFKNATKTFDDFGDSAKDAGGEVDSLASKIGKVEDKMGELILAGKQNSKEFSELQKESRKLREAQEDMTIASQRSLDTFAAMPGPIGLIGKTFKDLSVTAKLAKTGLQSMGLGFNTLGKAIISSGVGAIVILFGLLATAVIKALGSFKPLQAAMDRFKVLFEVLGQVIEPVVELIGNALTSALDFLSKAIAFVTGSLDEYNKKLADQAATQAAIAENDKLRREYELMGDTLTEVEQKVTDAKIKAADKRKEINEDEALSEEEKANYIKMVNERLARDLVKIQEESDAKAEEDRKKKQEERKKRQEEREAIEKDFQNRLLSLENEFAVLSEENEFERQRIQLQQQKTAQENEISQLKVSESKKQELLDQLSQNYLIKLKEINDAETQVEIDKEKERQESIQDVLKDYSKRTEDLAADTEVKKVQLERDRALAELDRLKATEEEKLAVRQYYAGLEVKAKEADDQLLIDSENEKKDLIIQAKNQLLDATIAAAGQETKIGRALGAFKALMAFQETMMELKRLTFKGTKAVAEASVDAASNVSSSSKIGFPQNLITIAAAIAQGVALVSAVKSAVSKAGVGGSGGGSAPTGQNLGQNYERGGFIRGRRHAQGGVMAELEGGEAVMTRGAVSAFGPMLSMMNQMGGGVSFNSDVTQSTYDNPKTSNFGQGSEGSIIKTYVVEQELTTAQQRQARLKDLSTL